jgi:hypothetical protein
MMFEVEEQRITNAQTRKRANVPNILIFLTRRSLRWIGKLAKMPMNRLPRRLLAAWVKSPRKRGRPQSTLRNTMIESLQEALQDQVSQHAPLSEWIETAQDEKLWNDIIDKWHEVACQISFTAVSLTSSYNGNQRPDIHHRHTPNHQEQTTCEKESLQFIPHQLRFFQILLSQSSQPL